MFKFFEPKAYRESYLPEEDGHEIYVAEYGNPKGKPILATHGGPGHYCSAKYARYFNLRKYRVIMFDQRGCGKSKFKDMLKENTTQKTLSDMERIAKHLSLKSFILYGSSWASCLALLFAEKNPKMVEKLILKSVYLADKISDNWAFNQSRIFYPEIMEEVEANGKDAKEFYEMIISKSKTKQAKAMKYYCGYEYIIGSLEPELKEANFKYLNSSKTFLHYMANKCFIKEEQIIKNIKRIADIPTLIVHNRLDMLCPVIGAYSICKAMNDAKLVIVSDHGHGSKMQSKILKEEIKRFLA